MYKNEGKNHNNDSLYNLFKYEAKQFCLNTALHGFRFIVLPKRILLERVIWAVVVVIFLVAAIFFVCVAWFNFQENFTVIVTDSTHHPIWNYPFPAVTFCSYNKISKSAVHEIGTQIRKSNGETLSGDLASHLKLLLQLIFDDDDLPMRNLSRAQDLLEANDLEVDSVMRKLAPTCDKLLQRCKWKGEERRCENIFEQIRTTDGFCCSFNYYALQNHNFKGNIPKNPRRVSACGYMTALDVLLDTDPNTYFATGINSYGHKMMFHNSYDYPDWNSQIFLFDIKLNGIVSVKPTMTYATQNIRNMEIKKRKCLFRNERKLHSFVHYTYHNCMVECRMNISLQNCGCIPFYYYNPDSEYYGTKRICNLRDVPCLKQNREMLMTTIPDKKCRCLDDCEYFIYSVEGSSSTLNKNYTNNELNLFGGIKMYNQSIVRVFFDDLVATKNRRDISSSWHTLLAYYGGLLGLFIGFSFVSVVEILYFFTVRFLADANNQSKMKTISEKNNKLRQINVKPIGFEHLDPRKLMNEQLLRRRSNSHENNK